MGFSNDTVQVTKEQRTSTTDEGLSRNDVFEILRNERRRLTLQYLDRCKRESVPLRDVVDYVASHENETPIEELDPGKRKAVYTALRQSHFPKMDELGVVRYDHLRGEIELTGAAKDVQLYLEYVPENEIPWHEYYLGLTAVGAALLVVTWVQIPPFDRLSWFALTVLFVLLYGSSAVVHAYHARRTRLDFGNLF